VSVLARFVVVLFEVSSVGGSSVAFFFRLPLLLLPLLPLPLSSFLSSLVDDVVVDVSAAAAAAALVDLVASSLSLSLSSSVFSAFFLVFLFFFTSRGVVWGVVYLQTHHNIISVEINGNNNE
jgi:hypothetical protein